MDHYSKFSIWSWISRKVYLKLGESAICLDGHNVEKSKLKVWSKNVNKIVLSHGH